MGWVQVGKLMNEIKITIWHNEKFGRPCGSNYPAYLNSTTSRRLFDILFRAENRKPALSHEAIPTCHCNRWMGENNYSSFSVYLCYTHTHTHTHIYIYIYITLRTNMVGGIFLQLIKKTLRKISNTLHNSKISFC